MIIGIDASRANNEQKTGVGWYAYHIIQELKKTNSQFPIPNYRVVLYSDRPLEGELAHLPEHWESKVLRWPPKRLWTQMRLSWEMLVRPPDVLFIPAHVFPIIHPKKTVMTVHDIAAERFPESYNWFERWYSLWSARYAVKNLWKIIVPSEFTKKELLNQESRIKNQGKNIVVIHHGYDERYRKIENQTDIERILNRYSIKKPFILSIGRLEEKKNTRRIVEAFNRLKINHNFQFSIFNFQLVLVGQAGHGYEKVKTAIETSPNKSDIIIPGWVGPDELPYLMNAASVFVFPSLYEGFGLPVLEAFACGTPVVASKGTSLEEVGGDAAVYVEPENVEDIANGIERLLSDKSLREEKIQKGFERVKNFSWEQCARETMRSL